MAQRVYTSATGDITTSDTTVISGCQALYIGGAGDVRVIFANGSDVVFKAVPVGTVLPVAAVKVMATNTTATHIAVLR